MDCRERGSSHARGVYPCPTQFTSRLHTTRIRSPPLPPVRPPAHHQGQVPSPPVQYPVHVPRRPHLVPVYLSHYVPGLQAGAGGWGGVLLLWVGIALFLTCLRWGCGLSLSLNIESLLITYKLLTSIIC